MRAQVGKYATRESMADSLEHIAKRLRFGCGNHTCCIRRPVGMGTNGICHCTPREIARDLLDLAILIEKEKRNWEIIE